MLPTSFPSNFSSGHLTLLLALSLRSLHQLLLLHLHDQWPPDLSA